MQIIHYRKMRQKASFGPPTERTRFPNSRSAPAMMKTGFRSGDCDFALEARTLCSHPQQTDERKKGSLLKIVPSVPITTTSPSNLTYQVQVQYHNAEHLSFTADSRTNTRLRETSARTQAPQKDQFCRAGRRGAGRSLVQVCG